MATALRTLFHNIAAAIRSKDGTSGEIQAENFPERILAIPSGGGGTLTTKTIVLNGTYNASDDGADGYSSVVVDVGAGRALRITSNGFKDVSNFAYADVHVIPFRFVINDDGITPTGAYATSTYYNTSYGVKVAYLPDGDGIIVSMQAGTSTAYEYLNFTLAMDNISGLTLTNRTNASSSYATASPGLIYACVISGFNAAFASQPLSGVVISVAMTSVNATYDYTTCAITVTGIF